MFQGAKIDIICQIANLSISKLIAKWAPRSKLLFWKFFNSFKNPTFYSPLSLTVDNSVNNLLILIDNYFIAVLHFLHTFALAKQ